MLWHPDRLRIVLLECLTPPVPCELASYFKGEEEASGRVGLLGPYIPSSYTTGRASCCATFAECILTLLPRRRRIPSCTQTCILNIPCKELKFNFMLNV